jgi:hypothetical protein
VESRGLTSPTWGSECSGSEPALHTVLLPLFLCSLYPTAFLPNYWCVLTAPADFLFMQYKMGRYFYPSYFVGSIIICRLYSTLRQKLGEKILVSRTTDRYRSSEHQGRMVFKLYDWIRGPWLVRKWIAQIVNFCKQIEFCVCFGCRNSKTHIAFLFWIRGVSIRT